MKRPALSLILIAASCAVWAGVQLPTVASPANPCPSKYSLFGIEIGMTVDEMLALYPARAAGDARQYRFKLERPLSDLVIRSAEVRVQMNRHGRVCSLFAQLHGSIPAAELKEYLSRTWGRQNTIRSHWSGGGWDPDCGVLLMLGIGRTGRAASLSLDYRAQPGSPRDDVLTCV